MEIRHKAQGLKKKLNRLAPEAWSLDA